MNTNSLYICLIAQLLFIGCNNTYPEIDNLRKLTRAEIVESEKQDRKLFNENLIWYQKRKPTPEEIAQLEKEELYYNVYVDSDNNVQLLKLRPATYHDNITEILKGNVSFSPNYNDVFIDFNCDSLASQLEETNLYRTKSSFVRSQIRDSLLLDSLERDDFRFSEIMLTSVESKCGLDSLDIKSSKIIWSAAHHHHKEMLAFYFIFIEKQVEAGKLNPEKLALATDRLLMYAEYDQVYGTQISNSVLYPIRNVDSVNIRRAKIGLGPMIDYLEYFSLIDDDLHDKVRALDRVNVK